LVRDANQIGIVLTQVFEFIYLKIIKLLPINKYKWLSAEGLVLQLALILHKKLYVSLILANYLYPMKSFLSVITAALLIALTACAQNPAIKNLSVQEFETAIAADTAQVIDVRTSGEYTGGFIKYAKNIDQEDKDFIKKCEAYDKTKPVYIYCLSGGRSGNAAKRLAAAGFTQINNLNGGVMAWRNEAKSLIIARRQSTPGMSLAEFNQKTSAGTVLVEFWAPWCGPCKALKPVVEQIEKEQAGAVTVLYVDVDKNKELSDQLKIASIPVVQVYKNGKRTWNNVGMTSKKSILKKL
jgi:thioredoxin 1